MASSLSSMTSGEPVPTPTGCIGNVAPNTIDSFGFSGQVCQVSIPPNDVNITSCCNNPSEVRVIDNCTQYCEVDDEIAFSNCVNRMIPPSWPFLGSLCVKLSSEGSASASSTGSAGTSTPTSTDDSGSGAEETGTDSDEGIAAGNYGQRSLPLVATAISVAAFFLGWL